MDATPLLETEMNLGYSPATRRIQANGNPFPYTLANPGCDGFPRESFVRGASSRWSLGQRPPEKVPENSRRACSGFFGVFFPPPVIAAPPSTDMQPTRPLRPVMTDNTRPLRITATAGTKLVGAYFSGEIIIFSSVRLGGRKVFSTFPPGWFTTRRPSSYFTHEKGWIKLSPIVQNSSLLPWGLELVSTPVWRYVLANPLEIISPAGY